MRQSVLRRHTNQAEQMCQRHVACHPTWSHAEREKLHVHTEQLPPHVPGKAAGAHTCYFQCAENRLGRVPYATPDGKTKCKHFTHSWPTTYFYMWQNRHVYVENNSNWKYFNFSAFVNLFTKHLFWQISTWCSFWMDGCTPLQMLLFTYSFSYNTLQNSVKDDNILTANNTI